MPRRTDEEAASPIVVWSRSLIHLVRGVADRLHRRVGVQSMRMGLGERVLARHSVPRADQLTVPEYHQ